MALLPSNPRDRRALILLGGALGAFALVKFGVTPFTDSYRDLKDEVKWERNELAKDRGALEAALTFREEYARAESALQSVTPRLFVVDENDEGLALAKNELKRYVENMAQSNSTLILDSETGLGELRPDGLVRIRVRVKGESDLEGILRFLQGIETGPKIAQIDSLDIKPGTSQSGVSQNRDVLVLSAQILGYGIDTNIVRGNTQPPQSPREVTRR